ncbi:uncharacterized protein LOC141898092 [Tubulanus polymorphus]|uniref:uncharacterized protein LOC141898092 n=1 Tax=Tubulanus polymorphus TaxID=672921 RepID=UPI003DA69023
MASDKTNTIVAAVHNRPTGSKKQQPTIMQLKVQGTTCTLHHPQQSNSTLKWIIYFVTFGALFLMASVLNEHRRMASYDFSHLNHNRKTVCKLNDDQIDRKLKFARKIADILKELDVTYALCHGSLYGALNDGKLVPWDNVFDFCILDKDLFNHGLSAFYNTFSGQGINVHYNFMIGEYFLTDNTEYARLIGLRNLFGGLCKGGLQSMWSCVLNDPFDSRFFTYFMEEPLKQVRIHGEMFPVPNDEFNMIKFLKPESWWLDHTPKKCK